MKTIMNQRIVSRKQLKKSEYTLSKHNIKKIIYSTDNFRDRLILKCLYYSGMRRFEVCGFEIKDINYDHKSITIIGKGNKQREIPIINDEFLSDLKHYIGKRNSGFVFISSHNKPFSVRSINKIVVSAGKKAEVLHPDSMRSRITPHLFRHSIARHLKDGGYSIEFIQKFLGHTSFKTTMDMYGTLSIDDLRREANERRFE